MTRTGNEPRERGTGRYAYTLDRMCACGHTLGDHTAVRSRDGGKSVQPCMELTQTCECTVFRPAVYKLAELPKRSGNFVLSRRILALGDPSDPEAEIWETVEVYNDKKQARARLKELQGK